MTQQYQITKISRAKKRQEHVNIFLNDKYWINVHENFIVDHELHANKTLSPSEKQNIEELSQDHRQLERIYKYLYRHPHSVGEVRDYLAFRLQLDKQEIEKLINRFIQEKILDDHKFAEWYINVQKEKPHYGQGKIKSLLIKKKVPKQIIEESLSQTYSEADKEAEYTKIREFIKQNSGKIKAKDQYTHRAKLIQKLLRRGFLYKDVKKVMGEN